MQNKENQSENVTRKQEMGLVPVEIRVNPETVVDGHVMGKPVVYRKFGVRWYPCIIEMVTEEERDMYKTFEEREVKAEARERRCLIPNKKGGFIRCPECNKCRECKRHADWKFDNMHPIHIEATIDEDDKYCETIPIKANETNDGAEIMFNELADMIAEELYKIKPKYALIFREMFQGTLKPVEIATNTNLKVSTTYEDVPKVMKEAQRIFAILMK